MLQLALLAILIASALTIPPQDGRIAGGYATKITDHPYQTALEYEGGHICGAVISASKWIVTAAHCTNVTETSKLSIRYGITDLNEKGQTMQISVVHQHPKFNRILDYDISVLKLATDIVLGSNAQPIALPEEDSDPAGGIEVTLTGWGLTASGWRSDILQAVQMPLNGRQECRAKFGDAAFTDRMICAGNGTGDGCKGDSGGPLVGNGLLLGIYSWGVGCPLPGFPGGYTSVGALRSFIREKSGI